MHAHQLRASERFKDSPRLLPLPTPPLCSSGKCNLGRYGAEKGGYLVTAKGEVGHCLPSPHQGGHGSIPIREAMQWMEGMQENYHPTLAQRHVCLLFPSKAWERAKQEHLHHSLLLHSSVVSGFAGYLCHTLSERVNEKGRMPSAWEGLRAPLFLPLSSLSLSYQASTLKAAELWLLM